MTMFVGKTFTGDSDRIVKSFFNSIYDQESFLWALKLVVDKRGCVVNDDYCLFPEPQSPDPSGHFEGVLFGSPAGEVSISEASCTEYIDLACRRYVELCPGDAAKVADVLKDRLV